MTMTWISARALALLLASLVGSAASPAQAQPVELPLFRAGTVRQALPTPDGGTLIFGAYQFVDATPVGPLVALRPDASIDPAWSHQINGFPAGILRDPTDGTIMLFGWLLDVNGQARGGIARFAPDGTLLPWQASFPGFEEPASIVRAAVLPGGDVLALASVGGSSEYRLFRIGTGGGVATPLWTVAGFASELIALPDGSAVLAGSVVEVGGVAVSGAARLSGPDLLPSNAFDSPPTPIVSLDRDPADGRWYVASGDSVHRFEATGQADATWRVDADGPINRVKVDAVRGVLVAGAFTRVAGVERSRVARLRRDTPAVDANWVPPVMRGRAEALALDAGRVVVGGNLVSAAAGQVGLVVMSGVDGTPVPPALRRRFGIVGDWFQQRGHRAIGLADGGVVVSGPFTHTTDAVLPGILRLDATGALRRDWVPRIGGLPSQLTSGSDGNVYLSGFLALGGAFAEGIVIRVNLATGVADPAWRVPASNGVEQPFALDANHVYTFQFAAAPAGAREIGRWSLAAPANQDPDWRAPADVSGNIRGLQPPQAGGSLRFATWFAGGVDFDPPPPPGSGQPVMYSTRADTPVAAAFGPIFAPSSRVERVFVDPQGRTYLGGRIQLDGGTEFLFPRLRDDGTLDPAFSFRSPRLSADGAMALDPGGAWLYASVAERQPGGWDAYTAARFNTATGAIDLDWAPAFIARWWLADIAIAGQRVFVVSDDPTIRNGLPMLTAAFVDRDGSPLLRDGFEPVAAPRR